MKTLPVIFAACWIGISLAFVQAGPPTIENSSISAESALRVAQAALQVAHEKKVNAAVAVMDSSGRLLVFLRTDHATEQFVDGAIQKAWTAVNLRASTQELAEAIQKGGDATQLEHIPKTLFLLGGVPLKLGDQIVGAIGVAGSRIGAEDAAAAQAGVAVFDRELTRK